MQSQQVVRGLVRIAVWALVAWGIVAAIRSSARQLEHQQTVLRQRAEELERLADIQTVPLEADRLRAEADELQRQHQTYWKADWRYLMVAGAVYGASLLPAAGYWNFCMTALGQVVPWRVAFWAYFYGNLGKYFPGKAMVIVLRLSSLSPLGVRRVATSLTIFMETLTMMAVGGAVGAICLILLNLDWRLSTLAVAAVIGLFLPTYPPLMRYLLVRLQPGVEQVELKKWSERLNWKLVLRGWFSLGLTWVGFGLSLGLVLHGLPSTEFGQASPMHFWLSVTGACALAVVLGFVSLVPGGAGVREVVLSMVLAPVVGPTAALICAVWLRITWLVVELLMAAAFYCLVLCKSL